MKLLINLHNSTAHDTTVSDVEKKIAVFESLRQDIISLENSILALAGYGDEIQRLHDALRRLTKVVTCLEELQCYCSEGCQVLKEEYSNGCLSFQY